MLNYKNVKLIGSSHIAKESVKEIKKACEDLDPDIIALELDATRLATLISELRSNKGVKSKNSITKKGKKKKRHNRALSNIFKIGLNGYIFSLIGEYAEKKLGNVVGTKPGVDMMEAYKYAKKSKKQLALVDQDITITLKNLSKSITWKEKFQFLRDLFDAFVLKKPSGDIDIEDMKELDLSKVPSDELVAKMMKQTKKKYPNLYKSLVTDRNNIMAKNLVILSKKFSDKKILAVVGAGHEKEMGKLMDKMYNKVDVPSNVREKVINAKSDNKDNTSFTYKVKVDSGE